MEKKQVPDIRFQGFTDAWEQRKLGDLIREISTGKSVNSDEGIVGADNIGVLKTSCVSYDHFDPSESKPVVKDERHLVKCAVEEDSVIVSRMNTPERVGACGYVERSFSNLFLPDRLWKLKFQENVNTYFLYTMLVSDRYKEKITSMASGTSGSMYNIPKDAFLNLRLTLSLDIDEQKKIGDYFKQLDHLITLHQRKYEKLLKVKKSMLEKMFPRDGADVPEIRFDEFTDAWEQRKLGEVADLLTGFPFESKKFTREGIKLVRGMNVKRGYLDFSEELCECWASSLGLESYLLKNGDILIQMDGALIGKSYAKIEENQLPALLVQRVARARTLEQVADEAFIYQQIQKGFLAYIKGTKTETAVPHLSLSDIENFVISIPSVTEQKKVGSLFESLDHLITLHQRELEKLKNIKKSLLEKMFV